MVPFVLPTMSHTTPPHHVHRAAGIGLAALITIGSVAIAAMPAIASGEGAECFTLEPGTVGTVEHPTDPSAIVLRMFVGGGFVPTEIAFIETPTFTLYGNDVAIFQAPRTGDLLEPWPPFQCLKLTPDQVDELLTFALGDGGLADADAEYLNPNIVDVPSTIFTVDADGVSKTVNVHALGFDMAPEDQLDARAQFEVLAQRLADFGDDVDGEEPYHVLAYRAMLSPAFGEPAPTPTPWPWSELTPEDFTGDEYATYSVLTPEQVSQVTEVPNGGQVYIAIATPDGDPMSLSIRPLLPDDPIPTDL